MHCSLVAIVALAAVVAAELDARVPFFSEVFDNATAATQSPSYMTFTLVAPGTPVEGQSLSIASSSASKSAIARPSMFTWTTLGSALYTCSAFSDAIDTNMNTNAGGQDQHGDGHLNFITKSSGWVRDF
ncbi:hypothetical protein BDZ89DRAFT_1049633 [Hymenopellis radicata]|nr:hypothetical protein BDZ89DRAFT_1049633 [Hymenopellis radicata]